jgi:intein-encoded DNA endonuclease-like protein
MRTSTYTAWDRALNGELSSVLAGYRASGMSLDDITHQLRADHDIRVSKSTVARWVVIAEHEAAGEQAS